MAEQGTKPAMITAIATIVAAVIAVGGAVLVQRMQPNSTNKNGSPDNTNQNAPPKVQQYDLSTPQKAVKAFMLACTSNDIAAMKKLVSIKQQSLLSKGGISFEAWAQSWAAEIPRIESIGEADPPRDNDGGEVKTRVNVKYRDKSGELVNSIIRVCTERGEWKWDDR